MRRTLCSATQVLISPQDDTGTLTVNIENFRGGAEETNDMTTN